LHLSAQALDLLLEASRLGLGHIAVMAVGAIQRCEIARDAGFHLLDALGDLGHREILVAGVDRLELAAVDRHNRTREQIELAAQHHELCAGRADRRPVVAAEVGDRLEVRHQSAGQPHQLDIALALPFKPTARLDAIEIAVEIDLQQRRGMISRPTRHLGHDAGKPEARKVEFVEENFNDADGIVFRNVVVQAIGKQRGLAAIRAFNETFHSDLR
jgi:hypothetical protein